MAKLSDSATVDVKPILTGQALPVPGVVKAGDQLVITKENLKLILSELLQEVKSEIRAEMQVPNPTENIPILAFSLTWNRSEPLLPLVPLFPAPGPRPHLSYLWPLLSFLPHLNSPQTCSLLPYRCL